MEGEQFSLSWNEFHKNLSSGFNALLEDSSLVDVSLAVEGRKIQAHKVVLSVCSDYFKELFNGNPCQHPIVFLKDVNYVVMQNILQFMYQGEVNVSQADLADFLKTAEDLKVKGLTGSSKEKSKSNSSQEIKNNDIAAPQGMNRSGRLRRTQSPAPLPTPQVQHRKSAPASNLPGTKRAKLSMGPASVTSQPLIKKQCIEASDHSAEAAESRNVEHVDIPDTNTMLTNLKSEPIDYDLGDDTLDESMPLNEADMAGDSFEGNDEEPKPGSSVDFLQQGDDKDNINQGGVPIYFLRSLHGNPLLVLDHHVFTIKVSTHGTIYWACVERQTCKATCITKNGHIKLKDTMKHTHPPSHLRLAKRPIYNITLAEIEKIVYKRKYKQDRK